VTRFDIAVVGAGMVGASIAYHLARAAHAPSVLWLEAESAPGYHSTGRSAALYAPSYGPAQIRALTRAGRSFFEQPSEGFASVPLTSPRGILLPGAAHRVDAVRALSATLERDAHPHRVVEGEAITECVPVLRGQAAAMAVHDESARDIDVDALLQGFVRGARVRGVVSASQARVTALDRRGDRWRLRCADAREFDAGIVVNAAGAWADEVAKLAGSHGIALEPRRRSAFIFAAPEGTTSAYWPAVIDIDEQWYFKPDAGALLGSPANADPVIPHDVVAEEYDIALGIHRIEAATTMTIRRPKRTWAGLRSFVTDGEPVVGFDGGVDGFFWAAALGGYGIKTSPAFGRLAAALLMRQAVPDELLAAGLDASRLAPSRLG
jgi:D-arginine dehydrogenase